MAITLATAARNAAADGIVDLVDGGAGAGVLVLMDGATDVASFTLQDPAFGAAAAGVATLLGTTLTVAASDNGPDCDGFEVRDSDATVIYSGTVTATGGGGDITMDNTNVTSGQDVNLTSHTFTQPAS